MINGICVKTFKVSIVLIAFVIFSKAEAGPQKCSQVFASSQRISPFERILQKIELRQNADGEVLPYSDGYVSTPVAITFRKWKQNNKKVMVDLEARGEEMKVSSDLQTIWVSRDLFLNEEDLYVQIAELDLYFLKLKKISDLGIAIDNVHISSHTLEFDVVAVNNLMKTPELRELDRQMRDWGVTLSFREKITLDAQGEARLESIFLPTRSLFRNRVNFLDTDGEQTLRHELIHTRFYKEHVDKQSPLIGFLPWRDKQHDKFPDGYKSYFRSDEYEAWLTAPTPERAKEFLVQRHWLKLAYDQVLTHPITLEDQYYNHLQYYVQILLPHEKVALYVYLPKGYLQEQELAIYVEHSLQTRLYEMLDEEERWREQESSSKATSQGLDDIPF